MSEKSKPTINVPTGREVERPEDETVEGIKRAAKLVKNAPPLTPGGLVRNIPPKEPS